MAGQVSAAEGALRRGAETVARAQADLQSELRQLESQIAAIGGNWTGAGAVAFNRLMVTWNENSSRVVSALRNFEENLQASQTRHEATDESQQAMFQNLANRLG